MYFLEACQSLFQANTFDLDYLPLLGLWLNKMESFCPLFLKTNEICFIAAEILVHSVATCVQSGTFCMSIHHLCFRGAAKGRRLFPRQDGLFKGLVNVLWLFNFTTTTSELQEIISKPGQKIQSRRNPDRFLDKDSHSHLQRVSFCFVSLLKSHQIGQAQSHEQRGSLTILGRL